MFIFIGVKGSEKMTVSRTKTTVNKKPTKKCSCCNKEKDTVEGFYMASDDFVHSDGRVHICKTCFISKVDYDNPTTLIEMLRRIDKPFIVSLYESAFSNKNPIGEYMKNIAMPQWNGKSYIDSQFSKELNSFAVKSSIELIDSDDGIESDGEELLRKWGKFNKEDYIYLENFYKEYRNSYATDTPVQINLYKNIARVQLQAEKAFASSDIKQYKELMELSSKMHNDGNIKPIQNTGANDDRGLSTYGLWIKEVEKEEPCEYFENKPLYEDYDSFKKYWEKWFIRPFKNIFNISKDFDVKDDD